MNKRVNGLMGWVLMGVVASALTAAGFFYGLVPVAQAGSVDLAGAATAAAVTAVPGGAPDTPSVQVAPETLANSPMAPIQLAKADAAPENRKSDAGKGLPKSEAKALVCDGVSYTVTILPHTSKPGGAFTLGIVATETPPGGSPTPIRVNKVEWYYLPATVTAYRNYLDGVGEGETQPPEADGVMLNSAPEGLVVPIAVVTGTAPKKQGLYDVLAKVEVKRLDGSIATCEPPALSFAEILQVFDTPAATFEAKDYAVGLTSLVPLSTWVPLFGFNMKYNGDAAADRTLTKLNFTMNPYGYDTYEETQFAEFGLFKIYGEMPQDAAELADYLESGMYPWTVWDPHGWPYEMPVDPAKPNYSYGGVGNLVVAASNGLTYRIDDGYYSLNFTQDSINPLFPIEELGRPGGFTNAGPKRGEPDIVPYRDWAINSGGDGISYIVCVRLSAGWTPGDMLTYRLDSALMQPYYHVGYEEVDGVVINPGKYVIADAPDDGVKLTDTYTPNFFEAEWLEPEKVPYSQFDVFDLRSGVSNPDGRLNQWNESVAYYNPIPGFARPRWDLGDAALEFVMGELMDFRQLLSVESWQAVLGISAHGTVWDQPIDVNVVFTDIGGDPFAPPGNGGFDPREGLDTFTLEYSGSPNAAVGKDYAFNGVWLWYDTNANGVFDPPVPSGTTGVTFVDHPMVPMLGLTPDQVQLVNYGNHEWEYNPFPPGGGDPWWKIHFNLGTLDTNMCLGNSPITSGRRRPSGDPPPAPWGYMGATEQLPPAKPHIQEPEYFVVMRADSGFKDISGLPGDGKGLNLGADTKTFIEPRRWNPRDGGHWDGGLLLRSQILNIVQQTVCGCSAHGKKNNGAKANELPDPFAGLHWQDFEEWNQGYVAGVMGPEAYVTGSYKWWTEAMSNIDSVKPSRFGVEVHDLVLTYSTSNRYAKVTPIMAGQQMTRFFGDVTLNRPSGGGTLRSALSLWTDPSLIDRQLINGPATALPPVASTAYDNDKIIDYWGIQELHTFTRANPGINPDATSASGLLRDSLTDVQYSFETAPFRLDLDAIDGQLKDPRSTYFPSPPNQPTLPKYSTWSGYQNGAALVAWGMGGSCYLADDGGDNTPYNFPGSSHAEADYENDVYVYVAGDVRGPATNTSLPGDCSGMWLVDSYGGRYYIESSSGNELTLHHGHGAYMDEGVDNADYPYNVVANVPTARGMWMIVTDTLPRGIYPRIEDWSPEKLGEDPEQTDQTTNNAWWARWLRQRASADSMPTAMLGVNLVGVNDPAVLQYSPVYLSSITVAFWGPDFDPDQLAGLDPNGELVASGVMLYEDTNETGAFEGPTPGLTDRIVPLEVGTLKWRELPEPLDLDGVYNVNNEFTPDDLSGDGVVFLGDPKNEADVAALTPEEADRWDGLADLAWVLELRPRAQWTLPYRDARLDGSDQTKSAFEMIDDLFSNPKWPSFWVGGPTLLKDGVVGSDGEKALTPSGRNGGDDLFIVVRTSKELRSFSEFRAMVPAKLPRRTPDVTAGIKLSPTSYAVVDTNTKHSPDEGAVQDFFGNDMLVADVATQAIDMTSLLPQANGGATIQPGGLEVAALGIDASANRPENLLAQGTTGQTGSNTFTVTEADVKVPADSTYYVRNQGWTNATVGCYLIGLSQGPINNARVEGYEITGVNARQLLLRTGAPRADRQWFVVKDPTFLEQLVVEFYDVGRSGNFDLQNDLLALNNEDPFNDICSGVAIYRDNDMHPSNHNGIFDPPIRDAAGNVTEYIDLPLQLDYRPVLIGTVAGEPQYQVKFSFAKPGTDNLVGRDATTYETQPRNRQWVPQTLGVAKSDPDYGPDFFVVVRAGTDMSLNDKFQVGVVSWGPNTPTEPDPDNFTPSVANGQIPGQRADEFDIFSEFPWGSRGVGYITLFQKEQPVYYLGYDKVAGKVVPRKDTDRSQRGPDFSVLRNWVRTNPYTLGRTQTITSLQPPQLDFVGVPTRQRVNADVAFTLLGASQVGSVAWDFGDGGASAAINPVHQYSATGFYTVQVAVTNVFGIRQTVRKPQYIEIVDTPYADFVATPVRGPITPGTPTPALSVTFTDLSVGGEDCTATSWNWSFGDGQASAEQNPVHRYTTPGIYSVTLEVTYQCSGGTEIRQLKKTNYITVLTCVGCGSTEGETGEGEGADPPASDITFSTLVKDKEGVVPLCDWVPLFRFTMSYGEEDYAPRVLQSMKYAIVGDSRKATELNYMDMGAPYPTDLLEFGMFQEGLACEDCEVDGAKNGVLDSQYDELLFTWDNLGNPVGKITAVQEHGGIVYEMDFIGDGTAAAPQFPLRSAPKIEKVTPDGNSYIVAVRSSATWRSGLTMGVQVWQAKMIDPRTGNMPMKDNDGKLEPIDSYSPDFYTGEILEDKQYYSSSFTVFGYNGSPAGVESVMFADAWNFPAVLYTPLNEQTRPRWNKMDQLLDITAGEFLQLKTLLSLDQWRSVMGINAHSTKPVHFGSDLTASMSYSAKDASLLREVNVVLTDIGADPYGPAGNGGFDPRFGLDSMTAGLWGAPLQDEIAMGDDVTFNGIWVWNDSNNNGLFDPPTWDAANNRIQFNGDYPMLPDEIAPTWEYVPLPPGGGDPWWKISLRLFGGTRKYANINGLSKDFLEGFLEKTPDNKGVVINLDSEITPDFFVVVRTNSGFKDVSNLPATNAGIAYGADFRAFIEPRRMDPVTAQWSGGIYFDSMIPALGNLMRNGLVDSPWQNDSRWLEHEPWWPQRTMNASTALPFKVGLEVHDLVLTYASDSPYTKYSNLFYTPVLDIYDSGDIDLSALQVDVFGYSDIGIGPLSGFDIWLDPFGLEQGKFQNGHTVNVDTWRLYGGDTVSVGPLTLSILFDDTASYGQYAFETAPFFNNSAIDGDAPPAGPRSSAYPYPPAQPVMADYSTWTKELKPGEYPRLSQWAPESSKARLLTQKTEVNGAHEALLGINLAGSADAVVNAAGQTVSVSAINVAFWGPGFTPDMLKPLDPDKNDNNSLKSGLLLWEDTDNNGIFMNTEDLEGYAEDGSQLPLLDGIVPVTNVKWGQVPELIDVDGDGRADDLSGDGIVDNNDRAWTLTLYPKNNWYVPQEDKAPWEYVISNKNDAPADPKDAMSSFLEVHPKHAGGGDKALDPAVAHGGDDLFISVALGDGAPRFQQFRALVPASYPTRPENQRKAGIQFFPQVNTSTTAFVKNNPDEDPVQDFYGHDMIQANVPLRIVDLTNRGVDINIGGAAVPTLGLDVSTNRKGTLAGGADGVGFAGGYRVPSANWTPNAFAGDFLVDANYESYEIVSNTANELTVLSGAPRNGVWRIVTEPTFFEEALVEFYQEGTANNFNPLTDLLPLDVDQRISGVAIYRDNDNNPANRNGVFDPDVDIPLILDTVPRFVGQSAEDIQVRFVFSTPGTDEFPTPRANQTRNRQWVQDSFGASSSDNDFGPDFFIVVRASQNMQAGDIFRMGLVSWGPNTPTEPDPDTWAALPGEDRNDFVKFREFPWGDRGVGFISYFKDNLPKRYFMDGSVAGVRDDNSGYNWLRSGSSKKRRTGTVEARTRALGPNSLAITSVSQSLIPSQTLPGEAFNLVIYGANLGANPMVVLSGYDTQVLSANNNAVSVAISTRPGAVPQEPVVLVIRNPFTGEENSRSDLFTLVSGTADRRPQIAGVSPTKGSRADFPVTVTGTDFDNEGGVQVYFGQTLMPVLEVRPDGASVVVGFPAGGMPNTGMLDVKVRNAAKSTEDILINGFEYVNEPVKKTKFLGLFGCGAGDAPKGSGWTDWAVLAAALGGLVIARRRRSGQHAD